MVQLYIILSILIGSTFGFQNDPITLYLIGDSTMSVKEIKAYPETGWGMPFAYFFDSSVKVDNRAKNGRSTKSFIAEKRWDGVLKTLAPGDYVIIQFGHNDESITKKERYATPEQYQANLVMFIKQTREKGATPILMTPVGRRRFDEAGNVRKSHPEYSPLVRKVAKEQQVAFIDLDLLSQEIYQEFGKDNSRLLFLQLKPGEHPNYPDGIEDNTHFNELGARIIAQAVLREIKNLDLELANRVVVPRKK